MNEHHSAGFGTDSSCFIAFVFDTPTGGERVQFHERSKRVRLSCPPYRDTIWFSYSVRRDRRDDLEWSGYLRTYFVARGNRFIMLYDQALARAILEALQAAP